MGHGDQEVGEQGRTDRWRVALEELHLELPNGRGEREIVGTSSISALAANDGIHHNTSGGGDDRG